MRKALTFLIAVALFTPLLPLHAQEEPPPPPAGRVFIEQRSEIEAVAKEWTLLLPNHESFSRTDRSLDVTDLMPGRYTFFAEAPEGTTAHIDVYFGDTVLATADSPQVSFVVEDKMILKLVITYSLTIFGKIGVSSDPVGVPFELKGPNNLVKTGVTPVEYPRMPVGNYSVTYKPQGCAQPPTKAGQLQKEGRVDFRVEIVCKDFVPVEAENVETHVTTEVGGTAVTFTDVPADAWFSSHIATIVKRGVMAGYTDASGNLTGKFGPGDPVTIAQLSKVAHTLMKIDADEVMTAPSNKLAVGQWFTRYFASAEELGWLVFLDATVDPARPATRGEVVVTLLQALDIPAHWPKGNVFTDVPRKTPYAGAIETAAEQGIVFGSTGADGKQTGLFHPRDPINRAELAKMLITVREKYLRRDAEQEE